MILKKRLFTLWCLSIIFFTPIYGQNPSIEGAWRFQEGTIQHTLVMVDHYLVYSTFDLDHKQFINTWGGPYTFDGKQVKIDIQFNAEQPKEVQQQRTFTIAMGKALVTAISGKKATWNNLDHNQGPLVGVWRISGRKVDDKFNDMPLGDRRTLKILSGTRFQWVAINIKTGEFSGTGGGTYTFSNNTYTENIEFFSRDNKRVGTQLSFEGKVENGQWHHSGLSSKGDPIYEIWIKLNG
ncbi:hypothetical protein GCM10023231_16210 [Olivibacter ginsenosidimutans]|uniref:Membrane or secreted protein n=1 Tax=Olivibacter ginsenosidimutans TaxID=1176537 RepID=A0ABP9B0T8_9SPHI